MVCNAFSWLKVGVPGFVVIGRQIFERAARDRHVGEGKVDLLAEREGDFRVSATVDGRARHAHRDRQRRLGVHRQAVRRRHQCVAVEIVHAAVDADGQVGRAAVGSFCAKGR